MSRLISENPYTPTGWHSRHNRGVGWRMIDIAEIIKDKEREFISLREFFTRIKLQYPNYTDVDIAKFFLLLRKEPIPFNDSNSENTLHSYLIPSLVKRDFCGFTGTQWGSEDPRLIDLLGHILFEKEMPDDIPF